MGTVKEFLKGSCGVANYDPPIKITWKHGEPPVLILRDKKGIEVERFNLGRFGKAKLNALMVAKGFKKSTFSLRHGCEG
ncbi:hypothetical protein M885DRAFT_578818 [Pelagophyceae sp. CCMP2097]|nr:hypothetical protein M885DRAFT_578818 [Pelagophyceae sp. CCMP2097]